MKTQTSSRIALLFGIFAALFPLTVSFSNGETTWLMSSSTNVVWCFLITGIALFLIIRSRKLIGNNKLLVLAILYILVPFTFRFSANQSEFLILHKAPWFAMVMILTGLGILISILKDLRSQKRNQV
jgi:peptidoglycan/LPS O-acetylase OafA/YrhL